MDERRMVWCEDKCTGNSSVVRLPPLPPLPANRREDGVRRHSASVSLLSPCKVTFTFIVILSSSGGSSSWVRGKAVLAASLSLGCFLLLQPRHFQLESPEASDVCCMKLRGCEASFCLFFFPVCDENREDVTAKVVCFGVSLFLSIRHLISHFQERKYFTLAATWTKLQDLQFWRVVLKFTFRSPKTNIPSLLRCDY